MTLTKEEKYRIQQDARGFAGKAEWERNRRLREEWESISIWEKLGAGFQWAWSGDWWKDVGVTLEKERIRALETLGKLLELRDVPGKVAEMYLEGLKVARDEGRAGMQALLESWPSYPDFTDVMLRRGWEFDLMKWLEGFEEFGKTLAKKPAKPAAAGIDISPPFVKLPFMKMREEKREVRIIGDIVKWEITPVSQPGLADIDRTPQRTAAKGYGGWGDRVALFIELNRARGRPARAIGGWSFGRQKMWAEVLIKKDWYLVDINSPLGTAFFMRKKNQKLLRKSYRGKFELKGSEIFKPEWDNI